MPEPCIRLNLITNYLHYVTANSLSAVALSFYYLADTYFISAALGVRGLSALNLSLPAFALMNGIGLMLALGAGISYSMSRLRDRSEANGIVTQALTAGLLISLFFVLTGLFASAPLVRLLGANSDVFALAELYVRVILLFSPLFILNNILVYLVRNNEGPRLAMTAMVVGCLANVVLDYLFIFPLAMGMLGAVLATCCAPLISIIILLIGQIPLGKQALRMNWEKPSWPVWLELARHGSAALINECSQAVLMLTFNITALKYGGNSGLAAYGVIANIAFVGLALFSGIGQGIQPLVSSAHAQGSGNSARRMLRYALLTAIPLSILLYLLLALNAETITKIFNTQGDPGLRQYATPGIRLYFLCLPFAALNIVSSFYFAARKESRRAQILLLLRGLILILPAIYLLSLLWGMRGLYLSTLLAEAIVSCIVLGFFVRDRS